MKTSFVTASILLSFGLSAYADEAPSGMPTGKRQHKPVSILKSSDETNAVSTSSEEQKCRDLLTPQEGVDCLNKLKKKTNSK